MKKMKFYTLLLVLLMMTIPTVALAGGEQFALPRYSSSDKLGVNTMALKVNTSLNTVAIGGVLGLSHSISTHENEFITFTGYRGTNDKFGGSALASLAAEEDVSPCVGSFVNKCPYDYYVMTVEDDTGSEQFQIGDINDPRLKYLTSFAPLRDSRHKLEVPASQRGKLVWTQPDGKKVTFYRSPINSVVPLSTAQGYVEKIEYPNGFTITIDYAQSTRPLSVFSNTGYQLKYNHFIRSGVGDASVRPDLTSQAVPRASTVQWDGFNVSSVVAINNAVERCDSAHAIICVSPNETCSSPAGHGQTCKVLTNIWPTAKFEWPLGMARAVYDPAKENVFKVTNAQKQVTEYYLRGIDVDVDSGGVSFLADTNPLNHRYLPRLMGIKPAGSNLRTLNYSYTSTFTSGCSECQVFDYLVPLSRGRLTRAWGIPGSMTYYAPSVGRNPYQTTVTSFNTIVKLRSDLMGGIADSNWGPGIQNLEGSIYFDSISFTNRLSHIEPYAGPSKTYGYDARDNVNMITINNTEVIRALYPTSCNSTNEKFCNQVIWTTDAKGNQTDYTYHIASGQVETVTLPANKSGQRAQTRYQYTPLSANYYDATGNRITGSPVYLKTAERFCVNTNYTGSGNGASQFSGACGAGDQEVVTRYEYNSDNLWLTGMTVAADGKTLRTCYQYDHYGNQIGKTEPNANQTSCN